MGAEVWSHIGEVYQRGQWGAAENGAAKKCPRRLARDRRAVFLNFPQGDWMITNIRVSAGSAAGRKRIVPMKTTA